MWKNEYQINKIPIQINKKIEDALSVYATQKVVEEEKEEKV